MGKLKVRAIFRGTGKGYYGHELRFNGDVFEINDTVYEKDGKLCIQEFSTKWMEFVDPAKAEAVVEDARLAPSKVKPIEVAPPEPEPEVEVEVKEEEEEKAFVEEDKL